MQAEEQTENLNALQRLLQLAPHPTVDNLRKPDTLHTTKHLTAWFDQWLQVYEMLPSMIHPKSVEEATAAAAAEAEGADGEEEEAADADAAGDGEEAEEGAKEEEGEPDIDPNDRRVFLKPAQVKEVRAVNPCIHTDTCGNGVVHGCMAMMRGGRCAISTTSIPHTAGENMAWPWHRLCLHAATCMLPHAMAWAHHAPMPTRRTEAWTGLGKHAPQKLHTSRSTSERPVWRAGLMVPIPWVLNDQFAVFR